MNRRLAVQHCGQNLIDNAVRFGRQRVLVAARTTGTAVVAEITDDGPASRPTSVSGCSTGSSGWTPAGSTPAAQPG